MCVNMCVCVVYVSVCVRACVRVWKPVLANHMYPDTIIADSYTLNSSEKFWKLAAEGKDINELRKTKQKYITDVSKHTQLT